MCLGALLLASYMLLTFGDALESLILHIASRTWEDAREIISIFLGVPFLYYFACWAHMKVRAIYSDSRRCPICASISYALHWRESASSAASRTARQCVDDLETQWRDAT